MFLGLTGTAVPIATHAASAVVVTPALQAACASTEFTAALAQSESLPRVSGACDLTGKMIVAGNLGVPVPDSDNASNSSFVTYAADAVLTAADHHSLRVDVTDGLITAVVDAVDDTDQPDDLPPDSGPPEDPTPVVEKPNPDLPPEGSPTPTTTPTAPTPTPTAPATTPATTAPTVNPTRTKSPISVADPADPVAAAAKPECTQNAWKWDGVRKGATFNFYVEQWSFPSYLNRANTLSDILSGAHNIDVGYNDCGKRQSLGTKTAYQGGYGVYPDIDSNAKCTSYHDGRNIVAFYHIAPPGILGVTCRRTSWNPVGDDYLTEADIAFDSDPNVFFYTIPAHCSDRYDLQGVATHEFGHVFGLGHVSESKYPALTMSPNATACSYRDSSLGLGDYNGLKKHYGS